MKVEIKGVKYAAFASQETSCFFAHIWIDGVKVGTVENDGHGGAHMIAPYEVQDRLNDYGKTLPVIVNDIDPQDVFTYPQDAESIINGLLDSFLVERAATRDYNRLTKDRVVFTRDGVNGVFYSKKLSPAGLAAALAAPEKTLAQLKATSIINLLPREAAIARMSV